VLIVLKSGSLNLLEPSGPVKACNGIALPLPSLSDKFGPGQLTQYSDLLQAGKSRARLPVGLRIFTHIQTGPGAHPASYTRGTGSFSVVKWPGGGTDNLTSSSAMLEKERSYTSIPPLNLHDSLLDKPHPLPPDTCCTT
jgi:hypothetical protein